jgi:alkylation response protein AidB-like acyl-CoA dehydrogenase
MEMTISRDRWQLHMKTRGQHYHELAKEAETLHARHTQLGADSAALALHALAEIMERARTLRLTRHQHILLRLGELIAHAESAACMARRAGRAAEGALHEKANERFSPEALGAIARVFARQALIKVTQDGVRWIVGSGQMNTAEMTAFEAALNLPAAHRAQVGLITDMDFIADHLYKRADKHEEVALQH